MKNCSMKPLEARHKSNESYKYDLLKSQSLKVIQFKCHFRFFFYLERFPFSRDQLVRFLWTLRENAEIPAASC